MSNAYLKFWGVRGSHAAPFASHLGVGGNTSCVEIRVDDYLLICDAGTGIIPLGNQLMQQDRLREMLVILTHYHWDHICGLPFFVPAFSPDWKINFFAPGEDTAVMKRYISSQMRPPFFPVDTETWLAQIKYLQAERNRLTYGPIEIQFSNVHHPGTTFGYRIKVNDKAIAYVSDNECLYIEKSITERSNEFDEEEHELLRTIIKEERDTEVSLYEGVDILIHDAQYTPEDYAKKRNWGHSCYIDTVQAAIEAGARELYLFHHDPQYDDEKIAHIHERAKKIIAEKNSSLICHVSREGMTIAL